MSDDGKKYYIIEEHGVLLGHRKFKLVDVTGVDSPVYWLPKGNYGFVLLDLFNRIKLGTSDGYTEIEKRRILRAIYNQIIMDALKKEIKT